MPSATHSNAIRVNTQQQGQEKVKCVYNVSVTPSPLRSSLYDYDVTNTQRTNTLPGLCPAAALCGHMIHEAT